MSSGGNPYQNPSSSNSAYNNASLTGGQQQQNKQSSLLLNSVNLAWSQPSGGILAAPKPEPPPIAASSQQMSSFQTDPPVGDSNSIMGQSQSDSPASSVSVNTSDYGKFSVVSSDFEKLSIGDSSTNLDNISHQAVAGSDTYSLASSSNALSTESENDQANEVQQSIFQQQTQPPQTAEYKEVNYHWFYQKDANQKEIWTPFSSYDSYNLEYGFRCGWNDTPIATNGTRYDVLLRDRTRTPVYWKGASQRVQRCSWFYKRDSDYKFVPYAEDIADILESTYRECFMNNAWNRRVDLASHEFIIFYGADSVYHYISERTNQDGWGAMMESHMQPRYAYRGVWPSNFQMDRDECTPVDHIVFMVHGIGDFCDLSFRKIVDVVEDFRDITADLLNSHYGHEQVGRVEILPISWHSVLHTDQLDSQLSKITLPSIPRMRSFTNDTILDALFYTATQHSQTIINAVATELNRIYSIYLHRNPSFAGSFALGGHSLGSLILFDLLSHQATQQGDYNATTYPQEQLYFRPVSFFAFGSPIPVFLTVRGITHLDTNFQLPTCPAFYNIFHPYDPIAYRFEPLINGECSKLKPVLIPHHKGRKRFHLEIRDSIARMSTDIKEKVLTSIKGTLDSIYGFVKAHHRTDGDESEEQAESIPTELSHSTESQLPNSMSSDVLSASNNNYDLTEAEQALIAQIDFGKLNAGRRIDYVLQERPIELVNEYVFAISAHGCYWLSEDTALLLLRELYGQRGIVPRQCSDEQHLPNTSQTAQATQSPTPSAPPVTGPLPESFSTQNLQPYTTVAQPENPL